VFAGYAEAAHNESAWIDFGDGRRWLDTGDLGRVDEDGYVWLTGRKKELIIRGGHNIDPRLIEEALHRHPAVALAAAIGRPDPHAGEVPVAYVELRAGADVGAEALLSFAKAEVSERAAAPKEIIILDKLPTTAVGKLFKPALTLLEVERVVRSVAQETGVALRSVEMTQDPRRGPLARVIVDDEGREALAKVLGRYAFAVHIHAAPDNGAA
jgi:fatty-acyl-CoA synthase